MDLDDLSPELRKTFSAMRLHTDDRGYLVVGLPRSQMRAATVLFGGLADPFAAMIVDKDEITIVMHDVDWSLGSRGLPDMRVEGGYRLITFDAPLALDTVGFMATVSRLLAESGVSLLPIAAYSRDHILVRARDFDRAWQALSEFIVACQPSVTS